MLVSSNRLPGSRAFTLVELLAGAAVFAIILLTVSGMVNMVSKNTSASGAGIEAALTAQKVFNMVGRDLASMVQREDVANRAGVTNNSPLLSILADVPVESNPAAVPFFGAGRGEPAVITYILGTDPGTLNPALRDMPVLLRSAQGLYARGSIGISGNSAVELPLPGAASGGALGTGDYDIVAQGIVRASVRTTKLDAASGDLLQARSVSPLGDKRSLSVSLAVIDGLARAKATPEQLRSIADALALVESTPSATPEEESTHPLNAWQQRWEQGPPGSVPAHLWNSVRFYQKTFSL